MAIIMITIITTMRVADDSCCGLEHDMLEGVRCQRYTRARGGARGGFRGGARPVRWHNKWASTRPPFADNPRAVSRCWWLRRTLMTRAIKKPPDRSARCPHHRHPAAGQGAVKREAALPVCVRHTHGQCYSFSASLWHEEEWRRDEYLHRKTSSLVENELVPSQKLNGAPVG